MIRILDTEDFNDGRFRGIIDEMHDMMKVRKSKKTTFEHCKGRGFIEQVDIESYKHWDYPWVILNSGVKPGMKILDSGAGRGFLQVYLAKKGCEVHSVDIRNLASKQRTRLHKFLKIKDDDRRVIRKINKRYDVDIKFRKESITKLSYEDSYFDIVFNISVLEHLKHEDIPAAVKELTRVVKPGGILALTIDYNLSSSPVKIGFNEDELMNLIIKPSGLTLKGNIDLTIDNWNRKLTEVNRFFNTNNQALSAGILLVKKNLNK